MDKVIKDLVKGHEQVAELYRALAHHKCGEQDPYGVYHAIKESIAEDVKARRLINQYGKGV